MRQSRAKKKAAKRRGGRDRDTNPPMVEVVERREFLVRLTQTREIEVKVMASGPDIAQELAANNLGDVTAIDILGSITRSVNEIG